MREETEVVVPEVARDIVEEVAVVARRSDWVDQSSGVSARLTIALTETVVSNAERRALLAGDDRAVVRVTDFFRAISAITGKLELVFEGEREGPETVAAHLIGKAITLSFDRRFPDYFDQPGSEPSPYLALAAWFKQGGKVVIDDDTPDDEAVRRLHDIPGVRELTERFLPDLTKAAPVFAAELLLEGLHQHSVLAKEASSDGVTFTDMVSSMFNEFDGDAR